jgi:RNA polymerase subunit RPABC4/transcription elongation factor Spt4
MSEGKPLIAYGDGTLFERACPKCGRFVKSDKHVTINSAGQPVGPNATCPACGRVEMAFLGHYPCEEGGGNES